MWVAVLQMTVLPLIVTNLMTAILGYAEEHIFGRRRLTAIVVLVAFIILGLGALSGVVAGSAITSLTPVTLETVAVLTDGLPILLFAIAFPVSTTRIHPDSRRVILQIFLIVSHAMMVLLHWILWTGQTERSSPP
jgi:Na+/H+-dicarboxylate symporter